MLLVAPHRDAHHNHTQIAGLRFAYPQVFSRLFAPPKVKQRFFPQCESCSSLQSDALRRGIKKMVAHFGGVQPYAYAGVLVGLRQYSAEEATTGSKAGSKPGGKAGSGGGGGSTTLDKWLADARRALR
jgi:hypothetical protein